MRTGREYAEGLTNVESSGIVRDVRGRVGQCEDINQVRDCAWLCGAVLAAREDERVFYTLSHYLVFHDVTGGESRHASYVELLK